ncbi:MAG: PAS domain S-box protein [Methylocystis sp.]|nr:PAS domain S-box protein [Methylocystis sp.]MCA3583812.1 PAS domain S-box protein [Methylocystis sp.]MCA3586485.1 PAS domain S-box protein [Methylocystis sp.]MCA3589914.1 PAS domain S-box protein [Methylocystis sp.]
MTDAISVLVTSLGDFPLDPDSGKAWLWSGEGERLLWRSDAAAAAGGAAGNGAPQVNPSAFRGFAAMLERPHPDREPVRVQQLSIGQGPAASIHTCLCRHVPLSRGGFGLLAVAIGAPARSLALMREPDEQKRPAAAVAADPAPIAEPKTLKPAPAGDVEPGWMARPQEERSPLRFVWQTDASGQFVHLSRELVEAVGPAHALLIGSDWEAAVDRIGIREADGIAERLRQQATWTAAPALWPVAGGRLLVPVEMAGVPVTENGRFAGFRGYGIARVERAVADGSTAQGALGRETPFPIDAPEDRFGPAVRRILDQEAASAPPQPPPLDAAAEVAPVEKNIKAGAAAPPPASPASDRRAMAPLEPTASQSLLTSTERETFREIARSLAALTGKEQEAAATPIDAAARRGVRPLEILKQDLINRTGVRTAETAQEPVRRGNAQANPVVPFEELQARRNPRPKPENANAVPLAALERLPIGLLILQEGKPSFVNRSFLDMTGHDTLEAFLDEGGVDRLFDARLIETGMDVTQLTMLLRNGERLPVEATIQATTIDELPATMLFLRKRPDMAQAAQSRALELDLLVARSELGELRSVLDTATDGVILLDGLGRILSLNRSAEALFGFDQNEIAGENLTVLLEPESHLAALDYLEGLKSNGVHSIMNDGRDVKGRERNGGAIPLFMTIGRIGDSMERQKFCAVLRDVTHWKKVEADLLDAKRAAEDSNANKTDFLTRISHEIRTPLNAVIGFSQVMLNEDFGPIGNERYKQYARDINASGAHIISLVNDLLDLAKVASGRLDLTFASVDVNALVAACVGMIQPQANAGRVIVRSQLASHMPPVVADERSVRQILLNLLSNAAKFTEAGGQVVASTTLTDRGEVIIRVRDTGIGMGPDDVRRALEPFRQIPGPRASGGTGLGLPLTKALVEANRAGFAIESEPGRGTLVEVTFPATRVLAE